MTKQKAYIFDVDGTLANHYDRVEKYLMECKNHDKFYEHCDEDTPICDVCGVYRELCLPVICVTARPERIRDKTEKWLKDNDLPFLSLFMRKNHDYRQDYIFKKEVYEKHIKDKFEIVGVFEDRDQCVAMWRSLGLTCFQVCDGSY